MASNSGTGLIDGNGKRNQLYRAFNAVYQPEKHGISEIIVQKIRHNLISSVDFKHHQSANSDVFNPGSSKVRIDDAMSTIRDESRKRYDRDEHSRIPERRWLSTRNIDESRMFLRINDILYQYGTLYILNRVRGIDWNRFRGARIKCKGVSL